MKKLDIPCSSTKTPRQIETIDNWEKKNFIGTIEAYTGMGKTRGIALRGIERYNPVSLIVAVPSLKLKEDWKSLLITSGYKFKVIVVNTLIKRTYNCDLLIIDEVHRFAAETFIKTFEVVKYNKILCLTATLKRTDNRHELLLKYSPIVDKITLKEGIKNGWVLPFNIEIIPVEFTKGEKTKYDKLNKRYEELALELGKDLNNVLFYLRYLNLKKWVIGKSGDIYFKSTLFSDAIKYYCKKYYFKQISDEIFIRDYEDIPFDDKGRKVVSQSEYKVAEKEVTSAINNNFEIPTKDHPRAILSRRAKEQLSVIQKRKSILYNAENKHKIAMELVEKHSEEYKFVLAQEISFLEKLYSKLPADTTRIYHSKMSAKKRQKNYEWFIDEENETKTLLSAKSLLTGTDVPKLSTLIITSFDSSIITSIQTIGRVLREYPGKNVSIYYLYIPGTQEEKWLKKLNLLK